MVNLDAENLRRSGSACRRVEQQDGSCRELDAARSSATLLKARLERQIELLLERRQALITAAVTGQLEIPGVAA